jgi:hypothetical protein
MIFNKDPFGGQHSFQDMPIYQAIKQRSFKPFYSNLLARAQNSLSPMMFMGGMKMESPLIKGSNFLRESDMAGINSVKQDMASYARQLQRAAALRAQQEARQNSFNRANVDFPVSRILNQFLRK